MASFDKLLDKEILHEHQGDEIEGGSIGSVIPIESVIFDTTYTPTGSESQGTLYWNSVDGTLDIVLNGVNLHTGQQLYFYGKASGAITKGALVQFAGVQGDHILMKECVVAEIQSNPTYLIGVASEDLANGDFGYVCWFGYVNNIYTDTPNNGDSANWVAGDILYFSNTTGGLTKTAPTVPNTKIEIAAVVKIQTGASQTGRLLVRPTIYHKLEEASDVDVSGIADENVLVWDSANSKWIAGSSGSLSVTTKGDLQTYDTAPARLPIGTDGYFLSADSGETTGLKWIQGQIPTTTTVEVTAGETLAVNDYVFIDPDDGKAYKLDIDTSPVRTSSLRGFVTESGGIATDATGTITTIGLVGGFSGLTPYSDVYASSTAGAVTQTKPVPTKGGGQIGVVLIGIATTATEIFIIGTQITQYMIRDDVADDGTLLLEHHSDPTGYGRRLTGFVNNLSPELTIAENATSNADSSLNIQGPENAESTLDKVNLTNNVVIGKFSNTLQYEQAQQFTPPASGIITEFSFRAGTTIGTPTAGITYEIREDVSDNPTGTVLDTGTFTVTSAVENTVKINGALVDGSTKYWLVFKTTTQATNNYYQWTGTGPATYASHLCKYSVNAGSTWTTQDRTQDFTIKIGVQTTYTKLAQSIETTAKGEVGKIKLYLKKFGSPTGNLTVKINTNNALTVPDKPSNVTITNGTSNTVSASTLTSSYQLIEFTFATPPVIDRYIKYWIVLETTDSQSNSNFVTWAMDSTESYTPGIIEGLDDNTWTELSTDGIFQILSTQQAYIEPINAGFSETDGTDRALFAHHDGSYNDKNTASALKNISGGTLDITFVASVLEEETDDYGSTIYSPTYNTYLNSLLDVDDSNISNRDILVWDSTRGQYTMDTATNLIRLDRSYAIIEDEKPNNSWGQVVVGNSWNHRNLNTVRYDPRSYVTLANDEFTLAVGEYLIQVIAPTNAPTRSKLRLYNVTQSSVEFYGMNGYTVDQVPVHMIGVVTSNGTDSYRIDHYVNGGNLMGYRLTLGIPELYTLVLIKKL